MYRRTRALRTDARACATLDAVEYLCNSDDMIRTWSTILVLLLITSTAHAQSTDALDSGEIFVKLQDIEGSSVPKMIVTGVVNAPPAKVFEIMTDCDKFPARLPRVDEAKTLKKSKTSHECEVTIGLPFPLSNLTAVTVDKRKFGPDVWSRTWTLKKGVEQDSYHQNDGGVILKPFNGDANRTLFHYYVHAVPKSAVPGFLRTPAQKKSLPGLVERVRDEVKKLP